MPLVLPVDSEIRPQDLTLDFYLEATPLGEDKVIDMSGKKSYTIHAFSESKGFGITNIDLDIKPSLQPVVSITFKDLYGNLVFSRDPEFNYHVLFQLPYPKFTLFIKGYTGKPVSFLLQVKSVKTTYQSSDGSYEIKAEFVPNVFGFFGDIPYQYLFAVGKLKDKFGETTDGANENSSIIQIAKNGASVRKKIQQVEDKYKTVRDTLTILASDPASISTKFNEGALKFDSLNGDESLTAAGFSGITFNLGLQNDKGVTFGNIVENSLEVFGNAILASINSPTKLEFKSGGATLSAFTQTDAGKKQIENARTIITANLNAISKAATTQGFSQVEEVLIDSQTIYNVMTRLAGDCAYILGYILEGGLNGKNNDPSRLSNNDIFGVYYPLVEENTIGTNTSFGEQKPWSGAQIEMDKVKTFCKALSEGIQEAQVVIDELSGANEGLGGQMGVEAGPLTKRITNAEVVKSNPYNGQNADSIIVNLIQRSGLLSCGYAGQITPDPSKAFNIGFSEQENFKDAVSKLRGTEKTTLRTFATEVQATFYYDGSLKKGFSANTINNPSLTLQNYFASYFDKFPLADQHKDMFLNSDSKSLVCKYMMQNSVMYYNPKDVLAKIQSVSAGANSVLNKGGKGEIVAYVPSIAAPQNIDQLNGDISSDSQIANSANTKFFQFFKVAYNPNNEAKYGVFLDYQGMVQGEYKTLDQLIKKYITGQTISGFETSGPNDWMVRLVDWQSLSTPKDFVTSLQDAPVRSYLALFSKYILELTAGTDAEQDERQKQKAEQEKQAAIARGEPVVETPESSTGGNQEFETDAAQIDAVYTQFHHICQAWVSLANVTGGNSLPTGTDINLRKPLESKYRNTDKTSAFYLNFSFPLLVDNPGNIKVEDAIINTDPLLENNAQTNTLNMMVNICTLNNFLLQPIPGGFTDDLSDLFKPQPYVDYSAAVGRNALSIIWSPTPENRLSKNDNSPIYPEKDFLQKLNTLQKTVVGLRFGSANNIFIKSIKAGTDDNKVTSESLQATSDIVNNQNQNKRKGFDCSMLAVMQGRSYKIGMDLIGNAQIFPTMNIAVDGLPLFTGLYWVTEVQHKITPNNMETSVEAVKMKYGGDGKNFALIMPITKPKSLILTDGSTSGGGGGNYSGGFAGGGDMNVEFLKRVKDVKIKNTADINNVIKTFTSNKYSDFPTWFNSEVRGKKPLFGSSVDKDNFTKCWDLIIPIEWPDYGAAGCNFLEFVAIHCIIYNETGGTYKSIHENMNSLDNATRPGIAYAYDQIVDKKKASYNKNKDAKTLFSDANFIAAHGSKQFGNDNKVLRSSDPAWAGGTFPKSLFANVKEAVKTEPATFINEADFYKFAGRGFIQTTWRKGYSRIVEWILTYNGTDAIVNKYKGKWAQAPFSSNVDVICTRSSNSDWDELFSSPTVTARAMVSHANAANKYQYQTDLTAPKEQLNKFIYNVARRISGSSDEYPKKHNTRVYIILDTLYPAGATNISNGGQGGGSNVAVDAGSVQTTFNDGKVLQGLIKIMQQRGHKVNERTYELNMVGIRSETTIANKFDDRIYVFWKNDKGSWEGADYPITTDPGTYWLKNPENVTGTAILKQGQWGYKLGDHRGYEALNQRLPVTVYRDPDKDNILNFSTAKEYTGKFGINVHKSSTVGTSTNVDNWSAGCQVFANVTNYNQFITLIKRHVQKYGNDTMWYTLIDFRTFQQFTA
jgi:hypothetical protein